MKELVKPNLTEEEYEEKENVTGYCDHDGCSKICFLGNCSPVSGDDDSGDILF